jgi:thiol-disulfide isomerase/thioredoxin
MEVDTKTLVYVVIILLLIILIFGGFTPKIRGPITVLLFYSPKCKYCRDMMGDWDKVEYMTSNSPMIQARKVDVTDPRNESIVRQYVLDGVPTIYKQDMFGNREMYNGRRSFEDLVNWINI